MQIALCGLGRVFEQQCFHPISCSEEITKEIGRGESDTVETFKKVIKTNSQVLRLWHDFRQVYL